MAVTGEHRRDVADPDQAGQHGVAVVLRVEEQDGHDQQTNAGIATTGPIIGSTILASSTWSQAKIVRQITSGVQGHRRVGARRRRCAEPRRPRQAGRPPGTGDQRICHAR